MEQMRSFYENSTKTVSLLWSTTKPFPECLYLMGRHLIDSPITLRGLVFVLALALFLVLLRLHIFQKVSTTLSHLMRVPKNKTKNLNDNFWYLAYYGCTATASFYLISRYQILENRHKILQVLPTAEIPPSFLALRMLQTAFYAQGLFTMFVLDQWLSDNFVMAIHHLVTILLQVFSYSTGYLHIGIIIEAFHDINDLFLNGAKVLHYIAQGDNKYTKPTEVISQVLFLVLLVSWFFTRFVLFYYYCIFTIFNDGWWLMKLQVPFTNICVALLLVVSMMNTFWFYLIVKTLYRFIFTTTGLVDIREQPEPTLQSKFSKKKLQPGAGKRLKRD